MRNLADPNTGMFDKTKEFSQSNRGSPDHFSQYLRRSDPLCESTWDYLNGCVHFNSGIIGKAFHLAAAGGQHHGVQVREIGARKLAVIVYGGLALMYVTSGFLDAGEKFHMACLRLQEENKVGIGQEDCVALRKAFHTVGLGD